MTGPDDAQATGYDGYRDALRDFVALIGELRAEDWALPTDLPGWTVQDNVSHVIGLESDLLGRPLPDHLPDWDRLPHVRDHLGRFMEVAVDVRRAATPEQLLAELREVVAERIRALEQGQARAEDAAATGYFRDVDRMLAIRPFDIWAHEQDIRRATARPGNLDSTGARAARRQILAALPMVIGSRVRPEPGTRVVWDVEGPLSLHAGVAMSRSGQAVSDDPEAPGPTVLIRLGWEDFVMLACGRRLPAACTVEVEGDAGLAERVLAAMAITP
ncbi:MAG TPA: maleylpyruvate isomerase family mycothiol-dependent enzyme [Actinomycetes bacterium]